MLAERNKIGIKVFYTWSQSQLGHKYDPGFGKNIEWDIPLLEGYDYTFVKNTSKNPGSRKYTGIKNPTLIKEVESWNPTAVLVFGWNFQSHLQCLRHFNNKVPVLFRGDSTLINEDKGIKQIARRMLLGWVYRHIDFAFYVGTQNKKYFSKHGLKENQLIFAPHAIDNARFGQMAFAGREKAACIRASLKITDDDVVLLYAGKLEPKKSPETLMEAFKKLNHEKVHLIIVGNGEVENVLKEKYKELKNLHFFPFQNQSELPVFYELCDVFVLPSKGPGETWGLAINEAMACGKPVIVSAACGCGIDLVEEGKNGFVFQSGNVHELAGKIKIFLAQKNDLNKMRTASLEKIKGWTFEKIANEIEQLVLSFNDNKLKNN